MKLTSITKWRIACLLAFNIFFCLNIYSQGSYSVYVGDRTLLTCPNPPGNSAISQTAWGSSGAHLHLEKVGNACYVTVTDYFTGTEQVQCDYYWYWYDNKGFMHTNNATTYYNFQCMPVTIPPSSSGRKKEVGQVQQVRCEVEVGAPIFKFKVWMRSGENMVFDLAEHPALRISDGKLMLVTLGHSVELDTADVRKFTIEDLTVDRMPEKIIIPETLELPFKDSRKIPLTLLPEGYDIETRLTWTSSRPDVVTVSQSGVVTAIAPGVAEVQVRATNGCTAQCRMIVPAPDYHLFVWLSDGHHDAYAFEEKPCISYHNGELILSTQTGEYRYEHARVHKITFSDTDTPKASDTETYVYSVESDSPEMERRGDEVSMRGMKPGESVYVYDVGGRLMNTFMADEDGTLTFAISRLISGIYIIKTETITYKIIKK